jgi:hypothetical protein
MAINTHDLTALGMPYVQVLSVFWIKLITLLILL